MDLKQTDDPSERSFPWIPVLFLLFVLMGGTLAWEFVIGPVAVGDGGYDLAVTISAAPGTLTSVRVQGFPRQDIAASPESPEFAGWISASPASGKSVKVPIQVSTKTSPLGREISRVGTAYLVVVADWPDGTQTQKMVPIPDSRVSQAVTVTLP